MPQGNKDPNHNAGHSTDKCLIPQINQGVERGRKKVAKSESHKKRNAWCRSSINSDSNKLTIKRISLR